MAKIKLFLGIYLLASLFGAKAEVLNVDPAELSRLLASGVPIIDIRTAPEWRDTGVIAGSKLMTFFDEKGQADAAGWVEKLKPIVGPNDPVILICRSGNRTSAVTQFLSKQVGYRTVYNVNGGILAWIKAGKSLVSTNK